MKTSNSKVLSLYPPIENGDSRVVLSQLATDYFFVCPTKKAGD